jgi:hypothetical protein
MKSRPSCPMQPGWPSRKAPEASPSGAFAMGRRLGAGGLHRARTGLPNEPRRMIMILPFLARFRSAVRAVAGSWLPDVIHAHWWIPSGWAASGTGRPLVITTAPTCACLTASCTLLAHRVLRRAAVVTIWSPVSPRSRGRCHSRDPITASLLPMPLEVSASSAVDWTRATPTRILYAGLVASSGCCVLIRAAGHPPRDLSPRQLRILWRRSLTLSVSPHWPGRRARGHR